MNEALIDLGTQHIGSRLAARSVRSVAVVMVVAIVLAALAAALVTPSEADARIDDYRIGLVEDGLSNGDLDAIGEVGTDVLRMNFSWSRAEDARGPCPVDYDWSELDRAVVGASEGGYDLLPLITHSPSYVPGDGSGRNHPHTSSPGIEGYKCFVQAAVERYGPGGNFPGIATGLVSPIRQWQVWNEPNLDIYAANGNPSPRQYGKFLKLTSRLITSIEPRADVIIAGMPELTSKGIDLAPYYEKLYRVNNIERFFDAAALHAFGRETAGVEGAVSRFRDTLRQVGDGRVNMWVMETSWSTAGNEPGFLLKTEREQKRELKRVFRMFAENRDRYGLGTVAWHDWQDLVPYGDSSYAFFYTGIYRSDGTPKPSCTRGFLRVAGGSSCPQILETESEGFSAQSTERLSAPDAPSVEARGLIPSPPE